MKNLDKRKKMSTAKEERQSERKLSSKVQRSKAENPPAIPVEKKLHGRDPEYYHSDNKQNRARPGKSSGAQSPHKHYQENEE